MKRIYVLWVVCNETCLRMFNPTQQTCVAFSSAHDPDRRVSHDCCFLKHCLQRRMDHLKVKREGLRAFKVSSPILDHLIESLEICSTLLFEHVMILFDVLMNSINSFQIFKDRQLPGNKVSTSSCSS